MLFISLLNEIETGPADQNEHDHQKIQNLLLYCADCWYFHSQPPIRLVSMWYDQQQSEIFSMWYDFYDLFLKVVDLKVVGQLVLR